MAYWALARLSPLPHLASVRWLAAPQAERQSSQAAPQRYRMEAHPTAAPVGSAEALHCRRFQWRLLSCRCHHRIAAVRCLFSIWTLGEVSNHLLVQWSLAAALFFSLIERNRLFGRSRDRLMQRLQSCLRVVYPVHQWITSENARVCFRSTLG